MVGPADLLIVWHWQGLEGEAAFMTKWTLASAGQLQCQVQSRDHVTLVTSAWRGEFIWWNNDWARVLVMQQPPRPLLCRVSSWLVTVIRKIQTRNREQSWLHLSSLLRRCRRLEIRVSELWSSFTTDTETRRTAENDKTISWWPRRDDSTYPGQRRPLESLLVHYLSLFVPCAHVTVLTVVTNVTAGVVSPGVHWLPLCLLTPA